MLGMRDFTIAALLCFSAAAYAQSPLNTSTYWLHEQQRRQAIANQIGTQEYLRWQNGLPSRIHGAFPYLGVFEPWPFIPGDIYGRQFDRATPQPLGHVVTPLGPNGYRYEPLYASPWTAAALPLPSTERPGPKAPLPPPQRPEEIPLPPESQLREF